MSAVPRVVLDTNLVLSSLVFTGGRLAPLRCAWQQGAFTPLVCSATAAELVRVLTYPKFKLTAEDQKELLADYLPYAETVKILGPKPRVPACRDPFDVPFLLLAAVGGADFLITGNQDLLSLDGHGACPIVTADAFLQALSSAGSGAPT